jgi:hypothetical protein
MTTSTTNYEAPAAAMIWTTSTASNSKYSIWNMSPADQARQAKTTSLRSSLTSAMHSGHITRHMLG